VFDKGLQKVLNEILRILKQGIIISFGKIGQGIIQIILLPIYTSILRPSDFGVLEMMTIFSSILSLLILMGIRQGFTRNYLIKDKKRSNKENKKDQKSITVTMIIFSLLWGSLLITLCFFNAGIISDLFFNSQEYIHLIILSSLWAFGLAFCQIYQAFLINNEKIKTYAFITTIQVLINLTLSIYLVVVLNQGVKGVIISNTICNVFFGLCLNIWITIKNWSIFSLGWLKKMLRFGVPAILGIILLMSFDMIDRLFLNHYFGLQELGVYSIGRKIVQS